MKMSDIVFELLVWLVKAIIGLTSFSVKLVILACSGILTATSSLQNAILGPPVDPDQD
jgi:hypothetical protein